MVAITQEGQYTAQTEGRSNFELIHPGDYLAVMTASEWKAPKNGGAQYLELTFDIHEGPHEGVQLLERLNLSHTTEITRKIAYQTLDEILIALAPYRNGSKTVQDSSDMHGFPLVLRVEVEEGKGINSETGKPYGPTNRVKKYLPYDASKPLGGSSASPTGQPVTPANSTPAPAAAPAQAAAVSATPPWQTA